MTLILVNDARSASRVPQPVPATPSSNRNREPKVRSALWGELDYDTREDLKYQLRHCAGSVLEIDDLELAAATIPEITKFQRSGNALAVYVKTEKGPRRFIAVPEVIAGYLKPAEMV